MHCALPSELPHCHDRIVGFFRRKGAYARFKDLLDSEGALELWYKYEAEATEKALRDWCAENDIQLIERNGDSAAQPVVAPDPRKRALPARAGELKR